MVSENLYEAWLKSKIIVKYDEGYIWHNVELIEISIFKLGKMSRLREHCVVSGHVEIGAYCLASFFVVFASGNHNIEPDKNINDQDVTVDPIIIGDDVWIGACAIITGGVHVGSHAVIGAGSVVTHDIPEWEIWAGNPAKKIGDRRDWKKNKIKQKIP